jgi:hypothetical protein
VKLTGPEQITLVEVPGEAPDRQDLSSAEGRKARGAVGLISEPGGDHTILPLPPASQIDTSVLDALPLQMKREIERAYGVPLLLHGMNRSLDPKACHSSNEAFLSP